MRRLPTQTILSMAGPVPTAGTIEMLPEGEAPPVSYVDALGVRWTYEGGLWVPSDGGEPTNNVWDIPGMSEHCPLPDCPPNGDQPLGTAFVTADGEIWTLYADGWYSSTGQYAATFADIDYCNDPGEVYVKLYVECGPADGPGIVVSVYTSGDIDAVESVTDDNDPARVYNNVDDVWFATWDEGADRPVTFTATLANGSTQTTNAIITAEECGIDETGGLFYVFVTCAPGPNGGFIVTVSNGGDETSPAIASVSDSVDPSRTYTEAAGVWTAAWPTGTNALVTFTATAADGQTEERRTYINDEACGGTDYTVLIKDVTCSYDEKNDNIVLVVSLSGDYEEVSGVTDNDTPPNTYSQSSARPNEWRTDIDASQANGTITITVTYTGGSDTYDVTLSDTFCGVPEDETPPEEETPNYTVIIKEVTCSYDEKNDNIVLIVSLSGDYEEVSGVTDNDTPPNTYSQSSARPNEWRTDIDASQANGTITITVTYTGGSDTADVTLSDTFCGVPDDTPQYNVEVDPNCEYDIEMREYVMTVLISGDLDGVDRVYDSLDTAVSYTGPDASDTYTRIIEEENSEIPTTTVTFTALMDNGESFSSSMDISPTNCGKSYYPSIVEVTCGYNAATGWLYVDVQIGYNQFYISAVGSVTDNVGGAKVPFVKISDDTWRTEQWYTNAEEVTFSGELLPGLSGDVDPLRVDTYNLGDDCYYESPREITFDCEPTADNGFLVKMEIGFVQAAATITSVTDANSSIGNPPGHAEFTTWVVDPSDSRVWTATMTRPELTSRSGFTYFTVVDNRGVQGGRNIQFLTLCG